jgi:hypothetical protein
MLLSTDFDGLRETTTREFFKYDDDILEIVIS